MACRSFRGDVRLDVGKRKIIAALNYWTILRHGPFWPDPEHINNSPLRSALLNNMENELMTHFSRQIHAHDANHSSNPNYDHAVAPADSVWPLRQREILTDIASTTRGYTIVA